MERGTTCTVKVSTDTLAVGQAVEFIRVQHFNGGSDVVVRRLGGRRYQRIPLMPGKFVSDVLDEKPPRVRMSVRPQCSPEIKQLAAKVAETLAKAGRYHEHVTTLLEGVSVDVMFHAGDFDLDLFEPEVQTVLALLNAEPELKAEYDSDEDDAIWVTRREQ